MATLDDIQQFLTRTGKPVPPTTVERVPLRGPKVEDTIFSPLLSAIHELLTSERSKQYTKDAMLKRMKQDNAYTGPTMKGIGLKEKVSDLLGGRSQNVIGEGPVSAVSNLLSGDLDPTTAAGASEAAIIPKITRVPTRSIIELINNNPQALNTTENPENAKYLLQAVTGYNNRHRPARTFSLSPLAAKERARQLTAIDRGNTYPLASTQSWALKPETQKIHEQIAQENPELVAFANGAVIDKGIDSLGLYYKSGDASGPRIRLATGLSENDAAKTLIHEYNHANNDLKGMHREESVNTPWSMRSEEWWAQGGEPRRTSDGELILPDDLDPAVQYISGMARGTEAIARRPALNYVRSAMVQKRPPLDAKEDLRAMPAYVRSALSDVNLNLARAHSKDFMHYTPLEDKYDFVRLTSALDHETPEGFVGKPDNSYDLRPLLEAILKLPRY